VQAQTWPNGPPTRIVQDVLACAEIRRSFSVFWGTKDDPLNDLSVCDHVVANESNAPHTSTICRSRAVVKCVLWYVSNGALVAEIWPFQV
jgi:hypothetical protein